MLGAFNLFGTRVMVRSPSASTRSAPQQPFVAIDGRAARIGNAAVIAENAERLPVNIKGDKRAVSVAIGASRAGNKRGMRTTLLLLDAHLGFPACSSSKVTATAAFADKRTFLPSTSATSPKSTK